MSYDLRIGVKVEGLTLIAVIDEPECSSPTYNLAEMFRACMGWDFEVGKWYNVKEVRPKIRNGIEELKNNWKKYKRLEPENGWGDVNSALRVLESLEKCIADNVGETPWAKWQEIPEENLWLSW